MSTFALVQPPEPEEPLQPPQPPAPREKSKGELRRERRQALLPQPDEVSIPMIGTEKWKKEYRARLLARDPHCVYCGCKLKPSTATAEHAIPRAKGGWNGPGNIWLACNNCNSLKSDRTPLEWLQQLYDACVRMGLLRDDDGEVEHAIFYAAGGWD